MANAPRHNPLGNRFLWVHHGDENRHMAQGHHIDDDCPPSMQILRVEVAASRGEAMAFCPEPTATDQSATIHGKNTIPATIPGMTRHDPSYDPG